MRNVHYFIALLFVIALGFASSNSHPVQGSAGYTAAPGDSFCANCHNPNASLNGTISVSGLPAEITPNQTYNLTLTLTNTMGNAVRGGFQMLVLNGNNQNSGTLIDVGSETIVKTVSGGKKYVGHQGAKNFPADDIISWEMDWTAPPTNVTGQAKFYFAGLFGNNANSSSGDRAVASNLIVPFVSSTSDPINLTISNLINPACHNTQDGSATVNITGGTPPYNILWNNGETTAIANALSGGTISVTVTDTGAGNSSRSATLVSPQPITLTVTTFDESCFGSEDGSASASATGGTGNKTFFWSNGGSGPNKFNLASGNYTVTATDANGCEVFESFTIGSPDAILINAVEAVNPSCFGENDGYLFVMAEGGSGGYDYLWSNGVMHPENPNLVAGTYTLRVTDNNSCTSSASYTLINPPAITLNLPLIRNVSCHGEDDGAINSLASGGSGGFTYTWSNGFVGPNLVNLAPAIYSVTVEDTNGCTKKASATITEPADITINLVSVSPVSCSGSNNGRLEIEAGPSQQYNFIWSNGITTPVNANISAGNYSVTVTDNTGCSKSGEFTVPTNAAFTLTPVNSNNVSCFGGSNGSAEVTVNPPGDYTINWNNGATGTLISSLTSGFYQCTATDTTGCASSPVSFFISQPSEINSNLYIGNPIFCFGDTTGTLICNPSGGTGDHLVVWSTGEMSDTLSGIGAGEYSLYVTDQNNCIISDTLVLGQPSVLTVNLVEIDSILCFGDTTGGIYIEATGGVGNYSFLWSSGQDSTFINDVGAGLYSVSVSDGNNCRTVQDFELTQPDEINVNATITPVTPGSGNNGAIALDVSGGTGIVNVTWSNGFSGDTIENLSVGIYTATITDESGCSDTLSYTVAVVDCQLQGSAETSEVSCFGGNDGAITVTAQHQNGLFNVQLYQNGILTDVSLDSLSAGVYDIKIVDSLFCIFEIDSIVIDQPDDLSVASVVIHPTSGSSNGSVLLEVSGGTGTYSYEWFDASQQKISSDKDLENVKSGNNTVVITDENGCKKTFVFVLEDRVSSTDPFLESSVRLFPNPTSGFFTLEWNDNLLLEEIGIYNTIGQLVLQYKPDVIISSFYGENEELKDGMYFVKISVGGKSVYKKIQVCQSGE
ncbi:MAG: T9SS type A sorting domain-containing protein [Saprospiraceae bacterium]|nr:T9SS type A sorting domain-containing protein [Saprospiraceae bacterium]